MAFLSKIIKLILLCVSCSGLESPFEVGDTVTDTSCNLSDKQRSGLVDAGFTKITCPFGVAISGTADYYDDYLLFMANVMACLLDSDEDGDVDDLNVLKGLQAKNGGPVLGGGLTREEESKIDTMYQHGFAYGFTAQAGGEDGYDLDNAAYPLNHETFHMHHTYGLAKALPDKFGVCHDGCEEGMAWSDISDLCRQTADILCCNPGYTHPENVCPDDGTCGPDGSSFPPGGDCNYPSCTCTEFYYDAAVVLLGGYVDEGLKGVLSTEFTDMFYDDTIASIESMDQLSGNYAGPILNEVIASSDESEESSCTKNMVFVEKVFKFLMT